jgi:hypothetical protein
MTDLMCCPICKANVTPEAVELAPRYTGNGSENWMPEVTEWVCPDCGCDELSDDLLEDEDE